MEWQDGWAMMGAIADTVIAVLTIRDTVRGKQVEIQAKCGNPNHPIVKPQDREQAVALQTETQPERQVTKEEALRWYKEERAARVRGDYLDVYSFIDIYKRERVQAWTFVVFGLVIQLFVYGLVHTINVAHAGLCSILVFMGYWKLRKATNRLERRFPLF